MAAEPGYVLDSSALIALVAAEPGAEVVAAALPNALISAVNLTESMTKLIRRGGDPEEVERLLRGLGLVIEPWTEALVWRSRDLAPLAWTKGLSFADRACLALARATGRKALTADRAWGGLGVGVEIELIRRGR
ncbi:MAG: PIN domain-containing protein [Terriglobales bacterium]